MSISKSLLQPEQAEEATKRADPSLKKTSPYSLGMVEWFSSDSYENFQAPRPKQRKSLSHGTGSRLSASKKLRALQRKLCKEIPRRMTTGLSMPSRYGQVTKTSVATGGIVQGVELTASLLQLFSNVVTTSV